MALLWHFFIFLVPILQFPNTLSPLISHSPRGPLSSPYKWGADPQPDVTAPRTPRSTEAGSGWMWGSR